MPASNHANPRRHYKCCTAVLCLGYALTRPVPACVTPRVIIAGLGPGDPEHLTKGVWSQLCNCQRLYARFAKHPVLESLPASVTLTTFDQYYEEADTFEGLYSNISDTILELAKKHGEVVYAVPGDPCVGETTTKMIRQRSADEGVRVEVLPGVSFVEPSLAALGVDMLPRLAVGDAYELTGFQSLPFECSTPLLISQVDDQISANALKLVLMSTYEAEHEVALVHSAGVQGTAQVEWLPLQNIDRSKSIGITTSLFVPASSGGSFTDLRDRMAGRRIKLGESWDDLTHAELARGLVRASEKVAKAAEQDSKESMGDLADALALVLIQAAAHMQLAEDDFDFSTGDVLKRNTVQVNTEEFACVVSISATDSAVLIVQEPPDVKQLQLEGFDLVLTWQQQHLELQQSRFFVPATPWLLAAEWPRFLSKKPGLGFLRGSKSQMAGHRLRHRIWEAREQLQSVCEVPLQFLQGGGISRDERNLQFFNQFVLVIENSRHENYFSEKLLDALAARTLQKAIRLPVTLCLPWSTLQLTQSVPVYWGCPNIGDFFDVAAWVNAGMVVLQSTEIDEVQFARPSLEVTYELQRASLTNAFDYCHYEAHQEALRENSERAQRYSGDFGFRLQQAIEEALQAQTDIGQSGLGAWDEIASPKCKKMLRCYMRSNASLSINEADCLLFVFAVAKPRLQRSELPMPAAASERMALGLRFHPSHGCLTKRIMLSYPWPVLESWASLGGGFVAAGSARISMTWQICPIDPSLSGLFDAGLPDRAYKQVVTFATRMKWPLLYGSIGGALILLLKMISDVGGGARRGPDCRGQSTSVGAASLYFAYVRSGQRAAVRPMPHDPHSGFQVLEAEANARCLIRDFNVPPQDVFEESWSLDTIGNAYMLRTTHTDIAGWRRLTIISNQFHMPRIRAIFDKVFGLGPLPSKHYSLQYREVPNDGMAQDVLEGRQAREAKSIENFRLELQRA
ncbi:yabN [Symbiodinium sp. CCMP2456]|nr:yabN [Symbiodinium sp. CCMP2456]